MVEIYSHTDFSQTQANVQLNGGEWNTVDVGFTPDSLIIKNNDTAIIYFRKDNDSEYIPIDAGETYEGSLKTGTTFQLNPQTNNPNYKVIASIN